MKKNFEFTGESKIIYSKFDVITVSRIRATRDMPAHDVKEDDLGGFIEKSENLSDGAWVADEAIVYDDACVSENARVSGYARVFGNAWVGGKAHVCDACVCGDDRIFD